MSKKSLPEIPTPEEFCLEVNLYTYYMLDAAKIRELSAFSGPVDMYCVQCKKNSVFKKPATLRGVPATPSRNSVAPTQDEIDRRTLRERIFTLELTCSRETSHTAAFIFQIKKGSICKIGQSPSKADIEIPELNKYRKLLQSDYNELTRAVGLASHGIGIGSFVYLRRIFERLVNEAAEKKHIDDSTWEFEEWKLYKGMDEKIKALVGYLPDFMVRNRSIYGILSKGVHQLDEKECLEYFTIIKTSICEILDDKLAIQNKESKRRILEQAIGKITGNLNQES